MKARAKTALGIDIGVRRIHLALVTRTEQGPRVLAAAGGELPPGPPEQREAQGRKVLTRLLAQLGRRSQVHRAPAAVALTADSLMLQLLDLPEYVPANIGEFVRSELQQYVALSGKHVISDFCGVGGAGSKRLLAVAAEAEEIEQRVSVCNAAGIAVEAVEPSILAYARAFLMRHPPAQRAGHVLLALLGVHTLALVLFQRGTLDFLRVRPVPATANTPALLCGWLAEELKAVVRYRDTQTARASRDGQTCVVVTDGVCQAGSIASALRAEGNMPSLTVVDACETWDGCREGPVATAAVGAALALLGSGEEGLRTTLLPQTVVRAKSLSRHVVATALAAVVVFLGLFAIAQLLACTTGRLDRRIEQTKLRQELHTAPALMVKEKSLDQEIARMQARARPLRRALAQRQTVDWPGILAAVQEATPAGVSIRELQSEDGTTLCLKGLTPSCPAAQQFVQNLENQKPFASSDLISVQRQQDGGRLEYRIDCPLRTKGGASG